MRKDSETFLSPNTAPVVIRFLPSLGNDSYQIMKQVIEGERRKKANLFCVLYSKQTCLLANLFLRNNDRNTCLKPFTFSKSICIQQSITIITRDDEIAIVAFTAPMQLVSTFQQL